MTDPKEFLTETDQAALFSIHLKPGESLDPERHPDATQIFVLMHGSGEARVETTQSKPYPVLPLSDTFTTVVVPPNREHSIKAGPNGLHLLTIYAPAHHHTVEEK
jgi:quercetin dioxygenase-like cupin family protein